MKSFSYAATMFRVTLGIIALSDYTLGIQGQTAAYRLLNIFLGCVVWFFVEQIYRFGSTASSHLRTFYAQRTKENARHF